MRITKLEHACMLIEDGGHRMFIDPGSFTTPITEAANVDAVVITHEHDDHWTPVQLSRIAERSPGVQVVTTAATKARIAEANIEGLGAVIIGAPGATYEVGAFTVTCFGGKHAVIHSSIPQIDNLGVVVNGEFAYGGDAYTLPPVPVEVLAVPLHAPWMRMAESIDYLVEAKPRLAIGVHDGLLNQQGRAFIGARIHDAAAQHGIDFRVLAPYETLEP